MVDFETFSEQHLVNGKELLDFGQEITKTFITSMDRMLEGANTDISLISRRIDHLEDQLETRQNRQ